MRRSWSRDAGAPAVPAALALAAGILLGTQLAIPPRASVLGALVLAGALAVLARLRRRGSLLALGALALALCGGYALGRDRVLLPARAAESTARTIDPDAPVEILGRLSAPWAASGSIWRVRLDVESATLRGEPISLGRSMQLVVGGTTEPSPVAALGDRVRVRGRVSLPDDPASPRSPFALPREPRAGVKSAVQIERLGGPSGPGAPVLKAHAWLKTRLEANLAGAPAADRQALALLLAISMGETSNVPPSLWTAFRDGGVAHLLAISGLQVVIVVSLVAAGLSRFRLPVARRDAILLVAVLGFAVFAGGGAPVLRSALMIAFYLGARLLGRPTSPWQVLGLSAVAILALSPESLFDVGFHLTFSAVFGLAAFGVPLAERLRVHVPEWLADAAGATTGAQIGVFPVQAFVFNTVPLVGFLSNLAIVPLGGVFLGAGLLAIPLLLVSPAVAQVAIVPLRWLADLHLAILAALERLHGLRVIPTPAFGLVALCAVLLVLAGALPRPVVARACFGSAIALMLAMLLWPASVAEPGTVRLQALDVGQGDSWLLMTPTGRVLVDGGGGHDPEYAYGRLRLVPKLADNGAVALSAVVLSHPHPDHSRGLIGVLAMLPVEQLVVPRNARRNEFLEEVLSIASRRSVPVRWLGAGDTFEAAGVVFEVVHPGIETYPRSTENNGSLVARARLSGTPVLFTGDIEALAERDLVARGIDISACVLKIAHHGSKTSTLPELLAAVAPRVGLIGVGRRNRFGHPSPAVLERLRDRRVRVLRTDRDGDFSLLFQGPHVLPLFAAMQGTR